MSTPSEKLAESLKAPAKLQRQRAGAIWASNLPRTARISIAGHEWLAHSSRFHSRETSPYVIPLLWQAMRQSLIDRFPRRSRCPPRREGLFEKG